MKFGNNNLGFISNWWWAVDRISVLSIIFLILVGFFMVATGSPAVAERIGLESFYFFYRHLFFSGIGIIIMFSISILPNDAIKKLSLLGFFIGIILLIIVLFHGVEIKGAKRWLNIAGMSLQPSEFIKPFFIVITAYILSIKYKDYSYPAFTTSIMLYGVLVGLIIMQPDFGTTIMVTLVWGTQLFIAGLSFVWILFGIIFIGSLGGLAYLFLPHVTKRVDMFINPEYGTENYQVNKSLEAFINGGLYGSGPGEGIIKQNIPDSHTDFIFAVAGEELGLIVCSIIILVYALIVIRSFINVKRENDIFAMLSVAGIITQFGLQSIINIGVNLNLFPTKGMTLPFISYGGSSTISISIGIGIMLAFTKKKFGYYNYKQETMNNILIRRIK